MLVMFDGAVLAEEGFEKQLLTQNFDPRGVFRRDGVSRCASRSPRLFWSRCAMADGSLTAV
jgi:hypothetical protein